ncbi:MAG: class I SAM-dependent methyltransferase [Defluviitaleaceae bacterium]|nr:class I SAM-dependent methyltransferase [Defluviitaleaceae bacterium]
MKTYETPKQYIDLSSIKLSGRILDIGGGGEGVISRHSGHNVIAIDRRADELAETPDIGTKIIMDACNLNFIDKYFDHITCFYTLMYMDLPEISQFLQEAYRVLKSGAKLWVWDIIIPTIKTADVFIAQLQVKVSEEQTITTGYGVTWRREQSLDIIKDLCENAGFIYHEGNENSESFSLCFQRQ